MSIVGTTDSVESAGMGRRLAAEFGRGSGLGPLVARRLPAALERSRTGRRSDEGAARPDEGAARPDVVVASSGSLGHVYFTSQPNRMTAEAIEARYPGLIQGLARHPGIGALLVRSAAGHALVLGAHGHVDLATRQGDGIDPLADFGPGAAENLQHLERFATAAT